MKQWKKIWAPALITGFLLLYFGGFLAACFFFKIPLVLKCLGAVLPLCLMGVSIYVLIERIHEIRSGDEDDLSKY